MSVDWREAMPQLVHDARALLRGSSLTLQLLERALGDRIPQEARDQLRASREAQEELDALLRRVAQLAEAERSAGRGGVLPLETVVLAARLRVKDALTECGAELVQNELPSCNVSEKLEAVLRELLENSVRFRTTEGVPRIEISARLDDGWVILEVVDNGIGWSEGAEAKLFVPFETLALPDRTPRRRGCGLGLPIAKAIVEDAGGEITGERRPEGGARFRMILPVE